MMLYGFSDLSGVRLAGRAVLSGSSALIVTFSRCVSFNNTMMPYCAVGSCSNSKRDDCQS